jgi:hypothetical protein
VFRWAKLPNTVLKISAIPSEAAFPNRDIKPVIKDLLAAYGPARCLSGGGFGGNGGGSSTPEEYKAARQKILSYVAHLSPADRALIDGGTAARLFCLGYLRSPSTGLGDSSPHGGLHLPPRGAAAAVADHQPQGHEPVRGRLLGRAEDRVERSREGHASIWCRPGLKPRTSRPPAPSVSPRGSPSRRTIAPETASPEPASWTARARPPVAGAAVAGAAAAAGQTCNSPASATSVAGRWRGGLDLAVVFPVPGGTPALRRRVTTSAPTASEGPDLA